MRNWNLLFSIAVFVSLGCAAESRVTARGPGLEEDAGDTDGDEGTDSDTGSDTDTNTTTAITDGGSDTPATCEEALATRSNIGCEYWAVDLDNAENNINGVPVDDAAGGQFAVAVANIGDHGAADVQVHINNADQGAPLDLELIEEAAIPEKDLYIFRLPRRDVDGENIKKGVDDGPQTWLSSRAFRITSDVPVVAYQFNPLNQMFSNDASLLLPTSGLGKDHLVLGYPPSGPVALLTKNRGYITIVGAEEDTTVDVTPTYGIVGGEGIDEIPAGDQATFNIGPFDVINLETKFMNLGGLEPDLTGTTVHSNKPVAVFFGTDLSMVLSDPNAEETCCAEHLEQQILPSEAMGEKFVVSHSAKRNAGSPEPDMYRIIAYANNTDVRTNLPAPNDSFILGAGEYREVFSTTGFTVESGGPLHVAQFLVIGTEVSPTTGDSSLLYVPAVDQRRGLYIFTTAKGFGTNWAVISIPQGAAVRIDDTDVKTNPECNGPRIDGVLGGITYEEWTCRIQDGVHTIHSGSSPEQATTKIGVYVYGYYGAGSYAYPAGSDLREINEVIVK